MAESVWIHYARPRPHWYALNEVQQADLRRTWHEIGEKSCQSGAEPLGQYHVRGQNDFETVEIWRFANAERAFDHWARLTAAGYGEWFAFSNNIGLKRDASL